jgi:hypothetical protein
MLVVHEAKPIDVEAHRPFAREGSPELAWS